MNRVLYITYDGILDPLGYSQVFQYIKYLSRDCEATLISFEKPEKLLQTEEVDRLRSQAREHHIRWVTLKYHKSPTLLATSFDILQGIGVGLWLKLRHRCQVVHARSYVAGVIGLVLKRLTGCRFLFDIRGFFPEERAESGAWNRNSAPYKLAKWFERRLFRGADAVVSLTHAGARVIREQNYLEGRDTPIQVITTCADLDVFRVPYRQGAVLKPGERFVLGYVGTTKLWYDFGATAKAFRFLLDDFPELNPFFVILNQGEHDDICRELARQNIPEDRFELKSCPPSKVPEQMSLMTASAFFIRPSFAKQASAPTKLGELLGCGVPVLINAGVGDSGEIVEKNRVGIVCPRIEESDIHAGVHALVKLTQESNIVERCRSTAENEFSITTGVKSYLAIYHAVASPIH